MSADDRSMKLRSHLARCQELLPPKRRLHLQRMYLEAVPWIAPAMENTEPANRNFS